jgi:lipopolysaccharide transport system permease protein
LLVVILLHNHIQVTFVGSITYFLMLIAATLSVIGIGFITSVLNARFRDVQFILPFLIQVSLFITPVFYLTTYLNSSWISWLHPLVRILDQVRIGLTTPELVTLPHILLAFISPVAWCIVGYFVFISLDKNITDVI